MEVTRDLCNLNVLARLMVLHRRIPFNVSIAAFAQAIPMRISAEQVPSLHMVASRYFKLVTSSDFWTFMLISALMFLLLVTSYGMEVSKEKKITTPETNSDMALLTQRPFLL